jgi:sphingomyelin phosphodiesterase acid-like 3
MLLALLFQPLWAQDSPKMKLAKSEDRRRINALMLSDLHVNVFFDPKKVSALFGAPAGRWEEILSRPDSPTRARDFDVLQTECQAGGDPSPSIFASALRSIASNAGDASFITISGDLLPHKVDCMFAKVVPGASPRQYARFMAKVIEYEVSQVKHTLPKATLYLALGNNDSNCSDDHLDTGTEWLKTLAHVAKSGVGNDWDADATKSFEEGGYYSVRMASPMQNTRLIVANDLLLSGGVRTCSGKADPAIAEKQMVWLRLQLKEARDRHEQVWFMAHIPPGMSAIFRPSMGNICKSDATFGANQDRLAGALLEYADITKLAIFGHTHLDQIQLLDGSSGAIPVKIVRAFPAYTIAWVDPLKAELFDYALMRPAEMKAVKWSKEYNFLTEYGYEGYTSKNLQALIAQFGVDSKGASQLSQHYMFHLSGGTQEHVQELQRTWPATVCQMGNVDAAEYKQCVCRSGLDPSLGLTSR